MSQKATASKAAEAKSSAQPTRSGKAEAQSQIAAGGQVLDLQRAYGNRAVQRMFESGRLQAAGRTGHQNKHGALNIAGNILRMEPSAISRQEEKEEQAQAAGRMDKATVEEDTEVRRLADEEDVARKQEGEKEEPAQAKMIQRQSEEDKEVRRQPYKEENIRKQEASEEEAVQGKFLQQQNEEKDEVRRQEEEEAQAKPEEEDVAQAKVQREEEDKDAQPSLQAKLRIGPANDRYEQEADRMAERVLSMPAAAAAPKNGVATPAIQQKVLATAITPLVRRQPAGDGSGRSASAEVANKIAASRGLGSPMPDGLHQYMGSRFGADFSGVRIHTDANADTLNRSLKAQAFTVGSDVYFAQGRYNPDSYDGRRLVAHELTHVVQQGGASATRTMPLSTAQRSIQRLSVKGVINSVLSYIPGFTLLTVILGENPVTGDKVPQTGKNLLKGAMELIPIVGPMLYGQLEETGSADKAGAWLDGEMKQLNITVPQIKKLIEVAWDRVSIFKGISGNKEVIKEVFGPVLDRIVQLVRAVKSKVQEMILEGALMMAGAAGRQVMDVLRKNRAALLKIIENPAIIITNFFKAVRLGFDNFKDNFGTHFKAAVMDWLFGAVASTGIELPKKFDLPGIFSLVMQVLGLTYKNIRARLVAGIANVYGEEKAEKAVSMIEKGFDFIRRIITEGPSAIWEWIKESLADLKEKVIDGILTWVRNTIVMKAIMKLVSMLNPVGALVQAAIAIYDVIVFFIDNWQRIQAVVSAIFSAIANVALGQLTQAAGFIEKTMAKGMTMLLAFLARLIGLGGISQKVREVIKKIQKPINAAIEKFVTFVVKKAKPIMAKISGGVRKLKEKGKAAVGKLISWWKAKKEFKTEGGEAHTLSFKGKGKNARLIIRSTPQPYTRFIAGAVVDTPEKKAAKDKALEISGKIDAATNNAADKKDKKMDENITKLLEQLAVQTAKFMAAGTGGGKIKPAYGALTGADFGTGIRVNPLVKNNEGSSVDQGYVNQNDTFRTLKARRRGGTSYYVAGHLLNNNLGGPGNNWKNLTPLTQSANTKDHEPNFEKFVKEAVNKNKKTVDFVVSAIYGSHPGLKTDKIQELKDSGDEEKADVIAAEASVPTALDCSAVEISPKPGQVVKVHQVQNKIDTNLDSYDLEGVSAKNVWLSEMISKGDSELMTLKGVDKAQAKKIIVAWKSNGGFRTWSQLAAAVPGLNVNAIRATSGLKVLLFKVS